MLNFSVYWLGFSKVKIFTDHLVHQAIGAMARRSARQSPRDSHHVSQFPAIKNQKPASYIVSGSQIKNPK